ncbi:BAI1-associated protein 3, partial [Stegodyphus mimosarum]
MSRSNIGKEKSPFFHRLFTSLHMLAEFFHRDEYMLPVSEVQNAIYRELEKELSLQKAETTQLIDMYYLQRMKDQNKLHHAPFGSLTVNAYYDVMK